MENERAMRVWKKKWLGPPTSSIVVSKFNVRVDLLFWRQRFEIKSY